MISRSVAQIATASMRTSTSARAGIGVGLLRSDSSSAPPSTQAFIWSGMGNSEDVVTPVGVYMAAVPCGFLQFFGGEPNGSIRRRNRFLLLLQAVPAGSQRACDAEI